MSGAKMRLVVYLTAGALAAPTAAWAEPSKMQTAEAQVLFDEGLSLMRAGKYAAACPKLQQSQKLDPGMGTQYRLAECYEAVGWIGSAFKLYTQVAAQAKTAKRSDREAQAQKHADALKARLPTVTVTVSTTLGSLPGLEITIDGEPVERLDWNRRMPIDPGAHTIIVKAPGKKPWQQAIRAMEGAMAEVSVPVLEEDVGGAGPAPVSPPVGEPEVAIPKERAPDEGARRRSGQRIAGVVTGALGLSGIVVGSIFGFQAKSTWHDALANCEGENPSRCSPAGITLGNDARSSATISTVGFAIGGAAVAAGAILFLTAPSSPSPAKTGVRFSPAVGKDSAFGVLEGGF
jgi:hypothetical protein